MSWKHISDFVGQKNIILEIGQQYSFLFEDDVIKFDYVLRSAYPLSNGKYNYTYKTFDDVYATTTSIDFQVRLATDKQKAKIEERLFKEELENLDTHLNHTFQISSEVETFCKDKKKTIKPEFNMCNESHLYRIQEAIPYRNQAKPSVKNNKGQFGKSTLKFQGQFTEKSKLEIVKALDAILAVGCVALFSNYIESFPKSPTVRSCNRNGIHYKGISNAWVMHPLVSNLVTDLSRKIVVFAERGYLKYWKATQEETRKVIQTNDVKLARVILKQNKIVFIKLLNAAYRNLEEDECKILFSLFINGIHRKLRSPFNLKKNWIVHIRNPGYYPGSEDPDDLDDGQYIHGEIADFQIQETIDSLSVIKKVKF